MQASSEGDTIINVLLSLLGKFLIVIDDRGIPMNQLIVSITHRSVLYPCSLTCAF